MPKKTYLSRIVEGASDLLNGRNVEQYAALCFRQAPADAQHFVEILLITTRESGRWIVPKGWAMPSKAPHEVAEREAWEEAGVKGKARKRPFGYYTYMKSIEGGKKPSVVEVFLLKVDSLDPRFPEKGQRKVEWFPALDAAALVREPELSGLITKVEITQMRKQSKRKRSAAI